MTRKYTTNRSKLTSKDKFSAKRSARQYRKYINKGLSYRDAFILYCRDDRSFGWSLIRELWNTNIVSPKDELSDNGVRFIYENIKGGKS